MIDPNMVICNFDCTSRELSELPLTDEEIVEKEAIITNPPAEVIQPTTEEILSQTVANLTLQNADLQNQIQTLSQTIAQMQLGGV